MMKTLWVVALAGCFWGLIGSAYAAEAADSLRLEINAVQRKVQMAAKFQLCAEIHNENILKAFTLYGDLGWGYGGGLVITIRDANKNRVQPRFLDDSHLVPTNLEKDASFVALQPQHFIGTCRSDKVKDLFRHPGKYDVVVHYRSPVPNEFSHGINFIGLEDGWLESNVVSVEVGP